MTDRTVSSEDGPLGDDSEYFKRWFANVLAKSTMNVGGCWVWTGMVSSKGYGMTSWNTKPVCIHRRIYEVSHSRLLATEEFVCHTCDERRCWNPAHLFVGDAEANNNDCAAKGRHHNTVKTHCKWGHSYEEHGYTKLVGAGTPARGCKLCDKIRNRSEKYVSWRREYQRRRRAEKRGAKVESAS
jgi:hypothetical protein